MSLDLMVDDILYLNWAPVTSIDVKKCCVHKIHLSDRPTTIIPQLQQNSNLNYNCNHTMSYLT